MPEGDTLHRIAARVGPALTGGTVRSLAVSHLGEVPEARGWMIQDVAAQGKHLLVTFDSDWTLRTHLGMKGKVFLARPGAHTPRHPTFRIDFEAAGGGGPHAVPESAARGTVVCARAYRAELLRTRQKSTHPSLARLGPDLTVADPNVELAQARARHPAHADRELADVLLDQRVAAGIGNVYKSELLFLHGIHPRARVGAVDDATLRSVYAEAARLLRLNVGTRFRTTVPTARRPYPHSPRLWVYGRQGDPCLNCGTAIRRFTQGIMGRGTWWCPVCQVAGLTAGTA